MPSRSSSAHPLRRRRALLVAGLTAGAVLVPSAAWATGNPLTPVTTAVQGATDGLGLDPTKSAPTTTAPATTTAPVSTSSLPPLDLSALNALLSQAGISSACSTSVEADIQQSLADIPATATALLQEILGQLGGGTGLPVTLTDPSSGEKVLMSLTTDGNATVPVLTSSAATELPLLTDIQQLLTDLLTKCIPAAPSLPTTLPTPTTSAAPVTAEAAQTTEPVSYLGYAPTGGSGPDGGSGSPALAVLGGAVLLAGASGATWYGVRARAARAQG